MQKGKFVKEYELMCESVDCNDRLRPNSFMGIAQEVADFDAERLGFGYRQLQPHNKAWILARMHFSIPEPATWKENVRVETWHRGTQGPYFVRDYVLRGEDGNIKVTGVSSWVILDTKSRKMERISDILSLISTDASCDESTGDLCPKIVFPRNTERKACCTRVVSWSDIDHNGHTNNAMYISWAIDCLPAERTMKGWCKEVFINFSRETMLGDMIDLYVAETAPGTYTVEGECGGAVSFTARLVY